MVGHEKKRGPHIKATLGRVITSLAAMPPGKYGTAERRA